MSSHPPYFGACRIYTICIVREEKRLFHADNAVPWSDRPEAPAEHPLTMEYDLLHVSAYLWRNALTGLIRPFQYLLSFLLETLKIGIGL